MKSMVPIDHTLRVFPTGPDQSVLEAHANGYARAAKTKANRRAAIVVGCRHDRPIYGRNHWRYRWRNDRGIGSCIDRRAGRPWNNHYRTISAIIGSMIMMVDRRTIAAAAMFMG